MPYWKTDKTINCCLFLASFKYLKLENCRNRKHSHPHLSKVIDFHISDGSSSWPIKILLFVVPSFNCGSERGVKATQRDCLPTLPPCPGGMFKHFFISPLLSLISQCLVQYQGWCTMVQTISVVSRQTFLLTRAVTTLNKQWLRLRPTYVILNFYSGIDQDT